MTQLFAYSIGASILLLILWLVYRALLSSEKRFATNRTVLLASYVFSISLMPIAYALLPTTSTASAGAANPVDSASTPTPWIFTIDGLAVIWAFGAAIVTAFTVVEIVRVINIIRRSEKIRLRNHLICLTDNGHLSPFSIGHIIVMNHNDWHENRQTILLHETGHIRLLHSADMVLAQLASIFCWYNPAAWTMRAELKNVHEFQADAFTLRDGTDAYHYQMFLVKRAAGSKFPSLANALSHCGLNERIAMMLRPAQNKGWHRLLYVVPVAAFITGATVLCTPTIRAALSVPTVTPVDTVAVPVESSGNMPAIYIDDRQIDRPKLNEIPSGQIKAITIDKSKERIDITMQ